MTFFPWFILALLVAINALYVAAEFAAVAAARPEILSLAKQGNARAETLFKVLDDGAALDRYISACQIGITLSSLLAGAYAQATLGQDFGPWLQHTFQLAPDVASQASAVTILVLLTAAQVVLGELIPKSLALEAPERAALFTFLPVAWSVTVYSGFIRVLNGTASLLLLPFGVGAGRHQHVHSAREIELLLAESEQEGAISAEAHQRLARGLKLSTRTVRQLMVPRSELDAIDVSTPPELILEKILVSPYSRLPVCRGSLDHIIGSVSSKDLASVFAEKGAIPPLESLIRPIPFVPESLRADRVIKFLEEQRTTKAVVVDEFGGVQGIITIEDVLAELLGEVGDELKEVEPDPTVDDEGRVILPGSLPLIEAEQWVGKAWTSTAATIGGHIVRSLGRLPRTGESSVVGGIEIEILEADPRAIRLVRLVPRTPESEIPPEDDGS